MSFTLDSVMIGQSKLWYKVTEIHATRCWIKVSGLCGSFQRRHVTNLIELIVASKRELEPVAYNGSTKEYEY